MTYATDQVSISDSAPQHLFVFTGTPTIYRYTSAESDVSYGGNVHTALAGLTHSNLACTGKVGDADELIVTMPITAQVVQDFGFGMPKRTLTFVLLRLQQLSGVALQQWEGDVADIAAEGKIARLRIPSKAAVYEVNVPGAYRQAACNLALYSTHCGVLRTSFDLATTVSSISANGKTIVVASVGGAGANYYRHGEIVRDSDGERRTIVAQSSTTLTLNAEFRDIDATDAVTLYAGCDKTIATCHTKFSNVANHRGLPYIRDRNPFKVGFLGRY